MATGGAPLLAALAVLSMLVMSSLGNHPRPLCSDCDPQCNTNCTAKATTSCRRDCDSPRKECERQVLGQCTANGLCCSSNGTCTCDCNTVAKDGCDGVTGNYLNCMRCMGGQFSQCYHPCKDDCNNNCRKKGCHA